MIAPQLCQLEQSAAKGLSLEFFIHEYVRAFSIVARLENASPQAILRDLEKLSCDPHHNPLQQPGILDRLCSYSEALLQTSNIGENLYNASDDLRISVSKQRLQMARKGGRSLSVDSFSLQDLQKKLRTLFPLLEKILLECGELAPVLFTLLELRQSLNIHLGPKRVETLLQKLFPKGPESLRDFLSKNFSERGFDNFIQNQEALFEGLTWASTQKKLN